MAGVNITMTNNNRVLTVIFGAGASYDCREEYHANTLVFRDSVRFPLTNELFKVPNGKINAVSRMKKILKTYRGAGMIGRLYSKMPNISLEDFLKNLKNEKSPNLKRNLRQVPLYFRELVGMFGEEVNEQFDFQTYYANLIHFLEISTYKKIVLITLNYDLLLDSALETVVGLKRTSLDSYIGHQDRWYFVKLHGSIDWVKKLEDSVLTARQKRSPGATDLEFLMSFDPDTDDYIREAPTRFEDANFSYRTSPTNGNWLYPVMVVPFGQEKKHICEDDHIEAIKPLLAECEDFLIVGNSMRDTDICSLLKERAAAAKRVLIVDDYSPDDRAALQKRVRECLPNARQEESANGFHSFIDKLNYKRGLFANSEKIVIEDVYEQTEEFADEIQ